MVGRAAQVACARPVPDRRDRRRADRRRPRPRRRRCAASSTCAATTAPRSMTEPEGGPTSSCPYHGWTYRSTARSRPRRVRGGLRFDRGERTASSRSRSSVGETRCSSTSTRRPAASSTSAPTSRERAGSSACALHFLERRHCAFDCNWKVFVDNYLDGGYHVPYLHRG